MACRNMARWLAVVGPAQSDMRGLRISRSRTHPRLATRALVGLLAPVALGMIGGTVPGGNPLVPVWEQFAQRSVHAEQAVSEPAPSRGGSGLAQGATGETPFVPASTPGSVDRDEGAIDAAAEPADPDADVAATVASIAAGLNCPTCQGYTLSDCPTLLCEQMRGEIERRVREGVSEEQIIAEFVELYGPQALNAPPTEGFFLLAWIMPAIGLALGALGVGIVLRGAHSARAAQRSRPSTDRLGGSSAPSDRPADGRDSSESSPDPHDASHGAATSSYEEELERLLAQRESES